ncbi:MAG: hypothetical protein JKY03_13915 [Aureispira sp.]|nr:hypothetical protein [Aureispira sp.]
MTKKNKKYLAIGGAALLLLILIFVFGKRMGKEENEERQIDVSVNIEDASGNITTYDPNPLLIKLNKGLVTRYYFDFSERCNPIKVLYSLDSVRFMATVRAYKVKYGVSLEIHMKECNVGCDAPPELGALGYFSLIYNRIDHLQDIIK